MKKTTAALTLNEAQKALDTAKDQYAKVLAKEISYFEKEVAKLVGKKDKLKAQKVKATERKAATAVKHKAKPTKATKAAVEKARDALKITATSLAEFVKEIIIENEKLAGVKMINKQLQGEEKILEKYRKEQAKLVAKKAKPRKKAKQVSKQKAKKVAQAAVK
jgi:hypothetical protein